MLLALVYRLLEIEHAQIAFLKYIMVAVCTFLFIWYVFRYNMLYVAKFGSLVEWLLLPNHGICDICHFCDRHSALLIPYTVFIFR